MNSTIVAALIAVAGTVVVAVTGFLTTRSVTGKTLKEQRTQTLNDRFATAASQLGGDKPPAVQLAGVYAMAVLADDWQENRQTCVDVLCGFLASTVMRGGSRADYPCCRHYWGPVRVRASA